MEVSVFDKPIHWQRQQLTAQAKVNLETDAEFIRYISFIEIRTEKAPTVL